MTNSAHSGVPEALERRVMCAVGFLDVTIGVDSARSVSFVDADGTAASVSVQGGAAVVRFTGEGLAQVPGRRVVTVSGTGLSVTSITVTGASRRSVVSLTAEGGDGQVTVPRIDTDGPLRYLGGPAVALTGTLATAGPVGRVELLSTAGATVALGAGAGDSSILVRGDAVDTDLTSQAPLRRVEVYRWLGTSTRGSITAPSAGRVTTEVFRGRLNVGDAGTIDLGGVETSSITVTGSIGQLRGVSAANSSFDVGGDIGLVSFAYLGSSRIFAGVRALPAESPVPPATADFVAPSSIRKVRLELTDTSGNAAVAARFIRSVRLLSVDLAPVRADVVFAADRVSRVVARAYFALGGSLSTVRVSRLDAEVRDVGSAQFRAL